MSIDSALASAAHHLAGWSWILRSPSKNRKNKGEFFCRFESPDFKSVTWEAGDKITTDILRGREAVGTGKTAAQAIDAAVKVATSAKKP